MSKQVVYTPSLRLPQPMTVPVIPEYSALPVGRQIGRTCCVKVTGESIVRMAMSLYWNKVAL